MNSRLEALINRGYNKEDVIRLATFTEEELEYASKEAFKHISKGCTKVNNPSCIFIGGQPGCGKTVLSMDIKNSIRNAIEIGIDNYRMYHPHYLEIENYIKEYWKGKEESINNTPGNDIADFTHLFAGAMTDKLIEKVSNNNYNILLEWGMREPTGPLNSMKDLKEKGYNNIVLFVSTYKDISYKACNLRAQVMKDCGHIFRKVPKSFHDLCVETLPDSINKIYNDGYKNNLIDSMLLITRDGKVIWNYKTKELPGNVFKNYVNDYNYSKHIQNNPAISIKTNKNEMKGLEDKIKELEYLKNEVIYTSINFKDINNVRITK